MSVEWSADEVSLSELKLWDRNPKTMPKAKAQRLLELWERMGQFQTLAIGPDGECYDGHQRINVLRSAGYSGCYKVQVMRASRALTQQEREELVIASSVGTTGQLDWDELANWDADDLQAWGLDFEALADWNSSAANLRTMLQAEEDVDVDELWEGMPEFENEDLTPQYSVKVHFASERDRQAFAEIVGQTITENTKSIWYPKAEQRTFMDKRYVESE